MSTRIVLKIGGSFAASPFLGGWLRAAARGAGRVVIVSGGGAFADAVRAEQTRTKFDDAAAHDMALMAMSQFARALSSRGDRFDYADSLPAIEASLAGASVPVWAPWPMLRGFSDIPASWDVTSDSLAAWLATELGACHLIIAKHISSDGKRTEDALDPAFPSFRAQFGGTVAVLGPAAPVSLEPD